MKCTGCGSDNPENAQFCGGCGTSLSVSTPIGIGTDTDELPMVSFGVMRTDLMEGEVVSKVGRATLNKRFNRVGGKLHLTNLRLIFESHGFAQSKEETIIDLSSISNVQECWPRLFGIIPLVPNGIAIDTTQGQEHRFTLTLGKRGAWVEAILGVLS